MKIAESELIIKPDGKIYHLNMRPEDLCDNIIIVGDPARVKQVSKNFTEINFTSENREIVVNKGLYNNKEIMVLSTGMGTDNIDIVFNELDALANIDFKTREIKPNQRSLNIIRIGTSGSIKKHIKVGSYLLSEYAIGFDGLLAFYDSEEVRDLNFEISVLSQVDLPDNAAVPYVVKSSEKLFTQFFGEGFEKGTTATFNGFYGPQGRVLRLPLSAPNLNEQLSQLEYLGNEVCNFEMETSGIYGLAALLKHNALSINLILANRANGTFLEDYHTNMDEMIIKVLHSI